MYWKPYSSQQSHTRMRCFRHCSLASYAETVCTSKECMLCAQNQGCCDGVRSVAQISASKSTLGSLHVWFWTKFCHKEFLLCRNPTVLPSFSRAPHLVIWQLGWNAHFRKLGSRWCNCYKPRTSKWPPLTTSRRKRPGTDPSSMVSP